MKVVLSLALLPLLASTSPIVLPGSIHNDAAPLLSSTNSEAIPDSYIIIFKKDVKSTHAASHHDWVQELHLKTEDAKTELRKRSQFPLVTGVFEGLKHTYDIAGGLLGYSGHFDADVIEQVRRHPDVRTPPAVRRYLVLARDYTRGCRSHWNSMRCHANSI